MRDATEKIQVVANREKLPEAWSTVVKIKPKTCIRVEGVVGTTDSTMPQLSIFMERCSILSASYHQDVDLKHRGISTQFYLARLSDMIRALLRESDFEEFVPSYLSASVRDSMIVPLSVIFPGDGADVYLAPSPASQLREAVLMTGAPKVFAFARCFSAEVRDGYTSAESLIASCVQRDVTLEEVLSHTEYILKNALSDMRTRPEFAKDEWLEPMSWRRRTFQVLDTDDEVPSPEVRLATQRDASGESINTFSMVWPPSVILAEGHVEPADGLNMAGVTLHLERMVPLLQPVVLRRLRHLGL